MGAGEDRDRKEMLAAGLRAYPYIARAWGLSETQAARLLATPSRTYRRWKQKPEQARVDAHRLERLSLILGI